MVTFSCRNLCSDDEYHSLEFNRIPPRDLAMGMIFSLETIVGILGNSFVLYHHLFLDCTGWKRRFTDLILQHLTVANLLVIFSKGVPQTMAGLGWKHFLNEFGCKLVFYVHRVGRDVSIGTTCLLSVFQAITISPSNFSWVQLKGKAPTYVGTCSVLCWILNMLINSILSVYITDKWNDTDVTEKEDYSYCYATLQGNTIRPLYISLVLIHDGFSLVLMLWASGFMVYYLHRHKKRVQYLHRSRVSSRYSPETRATQSILVAACTFVSLWTISSIIHMWLSVINDTNVGLRDISTLIVACFPTVSPYILMSQDSRASRLYFACLEI